MPTFPKKLGPEIKSIPAGTPYYRGPVPAGAFGVDSGIEELGRGLTKGSEAIFSAAAHELSDEHDRIAASSQGITHFIGRVLDESGVRSTDINTLGFNELLGVIEQTCNDSWDLFSDLQKFNPYTNEMIDNLVATIVNIHKQIKNDAN